MKGARQTIAVIITFRQRDKVSLELRTDDDRASSKKTSIIKEKDF